MKWFISISIAFLLSLGAGLAYAHPPYWASAYGYRLKSPKKYKKHLKKQFYNYVYYPHSQVYYSPYQSGYYYPRNGYWAFAAFAPRNIRLGPAVNIQLGGPTPYFFHPTVVAKYPVPAGYFY